MDEYETCELQDDSFFECDNTMPIPDIGQTPHLLISKVRKHYMEYIIKLLSVNYENNQRLLNKTIRLPSAIWRCAKNIEMSAANNCMVVQLYRKNIVAVIKQLKHDTKKGKMFKNLYDCVNKPPENDKKVQTSINKTNDCSCQCACNQRKRKRRSSSKDCRTDCVTGTPNNTNIDSCIQEKVNDPSKSVVEEKGSDLSKSVVEEKDINSLPSGLPPKLSVETQDADSLMQQLEMLFQDDCNDDDLFEKSLCSAPNSLLHNSNMNSSIQETLTADLDKQVPVESFKKQSIDEHIASLAGHLIIPDESNVSKAANKKHRRSNCSKWLCEEYFLKSKLFELLDQLRDCNRVKLSRVKEMLIDLFGDDSDDEGVMSPMDESHEFVVSCKERIAPWVVRILTPFYIKGRIKGKTLFKTLAKHLIRLIYQCSKYPNEFDVKNFVNDFLQNHKMIRCEADFKQFRIDNI